MGLSVRSTLARAHFHDSSLRRTYGSSARRISSRGCPSWLGTLSSGGRGFPVKVCFTNEHLRHMLVGHARVSPADRSQSLDLLRDALRAAGADETHLYHDPASGACDDRPGHEHCPHALRPGGVTVVWKLDRLGRKLAHLVNTVQELSAHGVGLRVRGDQGAQMDTTTMRDGRFAV